MTSTPRTAVVRTRMPGGVGGAPVRKILTGPYPDYRMLSLCCTEIQEVNMLQVGSRAPDIWSRC